MAWAEGQGGRMARLFGAAAALREATHWRLPAADQSHYEVVPAARTALGEAAFAAAWAEGRSLTWVEAVTCALEVPGVARSQQGGTAVSAAAETPLG